MQLSKKTLQNIKLWRSLLRVSRCCAFFVFFWSLAGLMPDWCFYLPLEPSLEVSRVPLASFSYKLHYINQKLWLNIHWTSIKHLCLPGRPDSRMYCPDIIGRDSWVWDEQKTLYKIIPPTGWGNKPSRQLLSTQRSESRRRSSQSDCCWILFLLNKYYC